MGERRPARPGARDATTGKRGSAAPGLPESGKREATGRRRALPSADVAREATLVEPAVTLPTLPTVRVPGRDDGRPRRRLTDGVGGRDQAGGHTQLECGDDGEDAGDAGAETRRVPTSAERALARRPTGGEAAATSQVRSLGMRERMARVRRLREAGIEYIPGRRLTQRMVPRAVRARVARSMERAAFLRAHRALVVALATVTIVIGALGAVTGTFGAMETWASGGWALRNGSTIAPTPTPTPPPPAPDTLDPAHYVNKYGFDWPSNPKPIPADEFERMAFMLPYAYRATAAYDNRYRQGIEPEMLVWWTHAEGIGARINYSNCANHPPMAGTNYFTNIQNCAQANFWQLGYGNQFSVIYVLKNAFADLHGDPNDAHLVQQVGQWVLNYDMGQGTVPKCGGYSCTFPAKTIDQIMAGVNQTTGVVTEDNWWASVLSRDPAINCYMIAHALTFFNHAATRNWVGCYYAEPCWGYESNALGDVLAAWPRLRQAAHL